MCRKREPFRVRFFLLIENNLSSQNIHTLKRVRNTSLVNGSTKFLNELKSNLCDGILNKLTSQCNYVFIHENYQYIPSKENNILHYTRPILGTRGAVHPIRRGLVLWQQVSWPRGAAIWWFLCSFTWNGSPESCTSLGHANMSYTPWSPQKVRGLLCHVVVWFWFIVNKVLQVTSQALGQWRHCYAAIETTGRDLVDIARFRYL